MGFPPLNALDRAPLLLKLPAFRAFHRFGSPRLLPINLTVSVTYTCPSRCKTCDIWQKKVPDFTLEEYEKTFRSMEGVPVWVTVSGGDQFVRSDLPELFGLIRRILRPKIINLPMNGLLTKQIEKQMPGIVEATKGSKLIVNLSLDEIGTRHDEIRGARDNWEKMMKARDLVLALQKSNPHVTVGIHTVISSLNVARLPEIHAELKKLQPDSYITEVAEERVELGTIGKDITPSAPAFAAAADYLIAEMRRNRIRHPMGRLVESFRLEYYQLVKEYLERREQIIPCYAGWASAQIAPDGYVWGCCVRAESVGGLRENGYDFGKVWFSPEADKFRRSVYNRECACPLANASYTNMLVSPRSLARVVRNWIS
ncbi:MAG TPA: radical SAM protein [Thermoanaerobaculia bacterium]